MKLSAFCYSLHSNLGHLSISRSHLFELVAAYFGYQTYAGFLEDALPLVGEGLESADSTPSIQLLKQRVESLGYNRASSQEIVSKIDHSVKSFNLIVLSYHDAANSIRAAIGGYVDGDFDEQFDVELWHTRPYRDALENLARQDNAKAHYLIALLYSTDYDDDNFGDQPNPYWYRIRQQGRLLSGPEADFANAYETWLFRKEKFEAHLRKAAELGLPDALFELSRRFKEPGFFENKKAIAKCTFSPREVAEVAKQLGRKDDARSLLIIAAEQGDIDAIGDFIETYGHTDPINAWKWFYVAKELGTDLTQDHYVAIHEDGSLYDDDIGGNAFVGGYGGIKLPRLADPEKASAKKMAMAILENLTTDLS